MDKTESKTSFLKIKTDTFRIELVEMWLLTKHTTNFMERLQFDGFHRQKLQPDYLSIQ